ncbi:F-box only protein 32-like [Mizuhopecten yessoensis]|uniref:F-box only protein 32 n=1 Tax=Mizuhopecten yessoensis TaxID=6573 RepID=A0A210QF04_MIZYE|nr:F-box only protein 32-like [Mizuhopecten yessoensis]OWF47289.1 F-box only protein 32 [Mizuhopecten yessoensis]
MPFLGRDWRSNGDEWVKTHNGWEKLKLWRIKVFESLNENILARLIRLAMTEFHTRDNDWCKHHQPYIHYVKATSRERKILTSLSEAFVHLDMSGAVKDIRRFNYVCKVLQILLCGKLTSMSGTSQKRIINILDEMVNQVLKTKTNVASTRDLVNSTICTLHEGQYSHIGSESLWHRHLQGVHKMLAKLDRYKVEPRADDGMAMFQDLPQDCVRCILERLSDHKDVLHIAMTSSSNLIIAEENSLWKQLCFFHFTDRQLITFVPKELETGQRCIDWKYIYKRSVKRFGKKDVYADTLAICHHCDTLFWQSIGHPCISDQEAKSRPLSPEAFLNLFSI